MTQILSSIETGKPVIGFIGLGLMGLPMAKRLAKTEHTVCVWNRTPEKIEPAVKNGCIACDNPSEVARRSDIICLCLLDTPAVEKVVFGENGVMQSASKGMVLIDFSSIKPRSTQEFSETVKEKAGMSWIDAPVSGGVAGAESGNLVILAGGDEEIIDAIKPHIDTLFSTLTRIGPVGSGQTAKLCNQMIVASCFTVLAETTNFARLAGIDPDVLPNALAGGWADSKPLQIYMPRMAKEQLEPITGAISTLIKDVDTIIEVSDEAGATIPLTTSVRSVLDAAAQHGLSSKDITALVRVYRQNSPTA